MKIGFIKPDYGFRGGFEVLIDQLAAGLTARGHLVEQVALDATIEATRIYGTQIPLAFRYWHNEYMDYVSLVERADRLVLDDFDLVVATQPPTWHANHDNMVGLFFHQGRVFYDLSDEFLAGGFVDPEVHAQAVSAVRRMDAAVVGRVKTWLAGSETSAKRLADYWEISADRILPYRHPADGSVVPAHDPSLVKAGVMSTVGRHEWPKRTELAVAAAHASGHMARLEVVGGGSRLSFARDIDARLGQGQTLVAGDLWRNRGSVSESWEPSGFDPSGLVRFSGVASDVERDRLVAASVGLIAPAFAEDYGLTALEAFAARKPLIVCRDGGGLTEFVTDGETGLVTEPDPDSIAKAIDLLLSSPDLASQLGDAGHEFGRSFTLNRALDQFEAAL